MLINSNLPPSALFPWLTHQTSLTQKLEAKVGVARLEVMRQERDLATDWDKQVLQIQDEWVVNREIVMWGQDDPCWYARTIIPNTTYQSDHLFFERLQSESLGKLIFDEAKVERLSLIHYSINPQSVEYKWLSEAMHHNAQELWVRKSILNMNKSFNFFLFEILLPGLLRYIR